MQEIGKAKTVKVRKKINGKLVLQLDATGAPEERTFPAETWRVTRDTLGGSYGPDKRRKLVVGLVAVDMLVIRPQGTTRKRELTANLKDVWAWMNRSKANAEWSKKMLEKKSRKAQRLADERQARAEKRLIYKGPRE